MVDTIKLTLGSNMFSIMDKGLFQKDTMNAARGYFVLVQNPTKSELKQGIYKPRLTLTKRFNFSGRFEPTLTIELSLPKLLFGNNFDELQDSDFPQIVDLLRQKLREMGVLVFTQLLEIAPVSAIHYAKNIALTDGSIPAYYISKIKEANIKLSLDVNQTDYRNEGHSYKWHANSYEVTFYDKIKDLAAYQQSPKRAIETDNDLQLSLFEDKNRQKPFEVIRMEVRLNKRQMIGKLFTNTLGLPNDLTFQVLFSQSTAQKVLLHYLSELERQRPKLLDYHPTNSKALLADLVIHNPKLGPLRTLQLFGLKQALDSGNLRELRTMFGSYSTRSWYRLMSETKKIQLPRTTSPFEIFHHQIETYSPLRLVDFQGNMLNNDKQE